MDENFIRERIAQLRIEKGLSEYKLSLELGHSKGYIQGISSGRSLPSMSEFLYICEYFGITPQEFFDTGSLQPVMLRELYSKTKGLSEKDMRLLIEIAERLNEKKC